MAKSRISYFSIYEYNSTTRIYNIINPEYGDTINNYSPMGGREVDYVANIPLKKFYAHTALSSCFYM